MGCGVSKDCIADQSNPKSKKRFIHACREHLQLAIADKHAASVTPPHDYMHLSETPTLEEQGHTESAAEEEENESHVVDDDNAEEVITINHDDLEYLENKPPITQPLHSQNRAHTHAHTHANVLSALPSPHKPSHKSPLRELSISSNGKLLDVRKDHLGTFTINTSSPRSSQSYSGITPSRLGAKGKSSTCSPLHVDRVKPLSPIQAWNPHNSQSPNFIKTFADQQLCKEVDNIDDDTTLEVVGHSCNPVAKTNVVHFDNPSEELSKSNTDAIMDGFIEELQNDSELSHLEKKQQDAFESNQLTGRLMAYGNLSGSPNSYMKELLEHFDKSTEPLYMPTTPRTATWQSKLLETIDRDIDNILLEQQAEVAFLGKDQGADIEHRHIDHTRYESIEL